MKRFSLLLVILVGIAACGQPGPLYLPEEPSPVAASSKPQAVKPPPEPESTDPETESQTDQYFPY